MHVSATDAKKRFVTLCRKVGTDQASTVIKDQSDTAALVIDHREVESAIPLTAQFFKDNFSRCSALVKTGIVFRVTPKGATPVYVRRHRSYSDPLDFAVKRWREQIEEEAQIAATSKLAKRVEALEDLDGQELRGGLDALRKGVERLALGHPPFREGKLPPDVTA